MLVLIRTLRTESRWNFQILRVAVSSELFTEAVVFFLERIDLGLVALTSSQSKNGGCSKNGGWYDTMHNQISSEGLRNRVVVVRRQEHILREVDLDAMSLADRDCGRNLNESVKDRSCGLRDA